MFYRYMDINGTYFAKINLSSVNKFWKIFSFSYNSYFLFLSLLSFFSKNMS